MFHTNVTLKICYHEELKFNLMTLYIGWCSIYNDEIDWWVVQHFFHCQWRYECYARKKKISLMKRHCLFLLLLQQNMKTWINSLFCTFWYKSSRLKHDDFVDEICDFFCYSSLRLFCGYNILYRSLTDEKWITSLKSWF